MKIIKEQAAIIVLRDAINRIEIQIKNNEGLDTSIEKQQLIELKNTFSELEYRMPKLIHEKTSFATPQDFYCIECQDQEILIEDAKQSERTHDLAIAIYKTVEQFFKNK